MNETPIYQPNDSVINFTNYDPFAESDWGPKRDPLYIVIPISVIYISIFISGVLGNISTCIVIARNKCMHTATNYYLFSLAISDLLLLTSGLPPEIYAMWSRYPYVFGEEFCVLQGFAAEASANATVLTITAFTIERYVAICYPFLSHTLSKLNRAIKYIIYIWLFAVSLAIPQALAFGVVCEVINGHLVDEHCVCIPKRNVIPHAFEISTVLFFMAPMSLITILYILIGIQLHKSLKPSRDNSVKMRHRVYKRVGTNNVVAECERGESDSNGVEEEGRKIYAKNAHAARHVVKMLVAVVIAFFICWAPFHAQRLFAIYGTPTSRPMIAAFQILTYISGILYYLSTTVNPLLYHIMSHKFRESFKETYKQCCKKNQTLPGGRCYSSLSGRSSQVNSHSTDSQVQSALRYLEDEIAKLHENRRPLVVSFRKKKYPTLNHNPEFREAVQMLRNNYVTKSHTKFNTHCSENYHNEIHMDLASIRDSYEGKGTGKINFNRVRTRSHTPFDTNQYDSDIHLALDYIEDSYGAIKHNRLDTSNQNEKIEGMRVISGPQTNFNQMEYLELKQRCSFVEVNNLQPTHICPLNKNADFL